MSNSKFQRIAYKLMADALLSQLESGSVSTYGDQENLTPAEIDEIVDTIFAEVQRLSRKGMTAKERRDLDAVPDEISIPLSVEYEGLY